MSSPCNLLSGKNAQSTCTIFILAFLLEIGPEQLKILNGRQEEESADKKVFHKKPGIKNIKNAGTLQGSVNARGAEEQFVG